MASAWNIINSVAIVGAFAAAVVWGNDALRDLRETLDTQEATILTQEQQLEELEQRVVSIPTIRVPTGAEVLDVECLPVGERIRVEGNRAYDFCGVDASIAIEQIGPGWIDWGTTTSNVPRVIRASDECELELLTIDQSDPTNRRAEIRLRCS